MKTVTTLILFCALIAGVANAKSSCPGDEKEAVRKEVEQLLADQNSHLAKELASLKEACGFTYDQGVPNDASAITLAEVKGWRGPRGVGRTTHDQTSVYVVPITVGRNATGEFSQRTIPVLVTTTRAWEGLRDKDGSLETTSCSFQVISAEINDYGVVSYRVIRNTDQAK